MSEQPYEIELVKYDPKSRYENEYRLALFATLTGLERAEINERWPVELRKNKSWGGSKFIEAARALSFNVNPKFKKFDPLTPWPCILRVQPPKSWGWTSNWWCLVYNQGIVYNVVGELPFQNEEIGYSTVGWTKLNLDGFFADYPEARITSMLQVWMSENISLTQADF